MAIARLRRSLGAAVRAGLLSFGPRHFVFDLLRERVQFTAGLTEGLHVIAEHAFRGLLDALFQFIDLAARLLLELAGLAVVAAIDQFARQVERVVRLALAVLAERFVKLLREQRLDRLGLLGNPAHAVEQVGEAGSLLLELVGQFLALAGVRERLLFGLAKRFHLLANLLLLLGDLPRLIAHLAHLLGELAGVLFAEIVAQLLQILLGARAGSQRL